MKRVETVLWGVMAVAFAQGAFGQNLWLGGASISGLSGYSYVGVLTPLAGGSLGRGWVMRQWLDRVTYRYDGFVPDIHAVDYGYAPALGYQWALPGLNAHAALYGGVRVGYTRLDPYDVTNVNRGTHVRFLLQGQLTSEVGRHTENQLLAQTEIGSDGYFVRDRLMWRFFRHYTLGPEGIAQGSREYRAFSEGLCFGGITLPGPATLLVHADLSEQRGQATVGSLGVELTWAF